MKRFEVAVEISKQLIALASAIIVGVAALSANILTHEQNKYVFGLIIFQYCMLVTSVVGGILHLGAVANLVETAEKAQFENKSETFVSLFDNPSAPMSCAVQQWSFFLAVIALVASVIVDWSIEPF